MSEQSVKAKPPASRLRWLLPRLLLSVASLLLTLAVVEIGMRVFGLPRAHKAHEQGVRFAFADVGKVDTPFYVNQPGRITFTYDANPRGYFNERNEVHHDVNPSGFRGPSFQPKVPGELHLVCLGDSFTFGEGVRNEDIYPEVAARILRGNTGQVEAYNLGVGGYNTSQSLDLLQRAGFAMQPDVVVLGYTLNDAEPALFQYDGLSAQPVRRARELDIEAEAAPQVAPNKGWYRLRVAQLAWQVKRQRALSRQTVDYYQAVNEPSSSGVLASEHALSRMITLCRERDMPCVVIMFPLLFELNEDYPFAEVHQRIGKLVEKEGGEFIDLLPELKGRHPGELMVHPTDQHPNELVHEMAGKLLAERLDALLSKSL